MSAHVLSLTLSLHDKIDKHGWKATFPVLIIMLKWEGFATMQELTYAAYITALIGVIHLAQFHPDK